MKILLINNKTIRNFILPNKNIGNMWITSFDENGNEKNLINVEAKNGEWEIISNNEYYVIENSKRVSYSILKENNIYIVKESFSDNTIFLYCSSNYENTMKFYSASTPLVTGINVGSKNDSTISYDFNFVSPIHAAFIIKENNIYVTDKDSNYGTYLNDIRITEPTKVNYGDIVFIMGLRILFLKNEGSIIIGISNPNGKVKTTLTEVNISRPKEKFDEATDEKEIILYSEDDYFHKKPRFIYSVEDYELQIDAPPNKQSKQDMPLIVTLGPMMTMSITSVVMLYTTINRVLDEETTWEKAMPSLVSSGVMLISFLLWPLITNLIQRKMEKKKEKNRQLKYNEYIDLKKTKISEEKNRQEEILKKRYPSLQECENIIMNQEDRLWEKRVEDNDFFTASVGIGNLPMQLKIKLPDEHFSIDEDNLKSKLKELSSEDKNLTNVPIPFSFSENYVSALIGPDKLVNKVMNNILLQLISSHSYDNLKIAVFTSKEKDYNWDDIKTLPHIFSNDRSIRYFATDNDEYKELTYNLERIYNQRKDNYKEENARKTFYNPVYLIITDSFNSIRNYDFIQNIIDSKVNLGFSIIILNDKISNLPDNTQTFIELSNNQCEMFKNIANNERIKFNIDNIPIDIKHCSKILANIPIEINEDNEGTIPKKVGFLEMYDIGKVEQLNSINRWDKNVPINNMGAIVGVGKNGDKISLDLHEKFHGPHGLIAGMTGSGKSEFIITYILSLAVNYHPHEVQFVLIDYKGGGLAGAFENKAAGYKLPHLVGVITNLDKNEVNRSLASIESELKRRQALFNKAREISGESTIDIYKYQKMYRNKIVDEPVSHLLIIADEFAELKTQQPEFMEQLISTARIGRSLGVHLILATQKPSGVVDSQIWSNTRFRVCLRVQEKSDSSEVIQCPDAAYLTQTGRFYLQVGFNEIFLLGQSAWAGGKYIPSENMLKTIDSTINFINNTGYVIKNVETKEKEEEATTNGEELINIVEYLCDCAKKENIVTKPLWLEKMPGFSLVTDIVQKYNYSKEKYMLNPIIGEYDVPNMQEQHILTIPFYKEGNAIVYGMAGAGKENFITTMIYSSMLAYTPEEVNYYILDFGAEILRYFDNSPIVGDIIYIDESEKVKNLFKMISDEIDMRKKLFAKYNGTYESYCKNSGKGLPNIVVVVNNYEAYAETYQEHEDLLIVLSRDCIKYGIYFIFTCNTPSGVRFKLRQNFSQSFVLQQTNEDDYTTILGSINKTYPSKTFGRGLIKKDRIYEFQTACVGPRDNISEYVKVLNKKISDLYDTKAKKIPILPEKVIYDEIEDKDEISDIIVGIGKSELLPVSYNFTKNHVNIVTTQDFSLFDTFVNPFIEQFQFNKNMETIVINADEFDCSDAVKEKFTYIDSNFDKIYNNLIEILTNNKTKYESNNFDKSIFNNQKKVNVIIIGINSFKTKLSSEIQTKFGDLFTTASDLGTVNFIIIDSADKIKNFEYEAWFKSNHNKNDGIWIGNGLNDQYLINVTQRIPEAKEELPYNFCFVIKRGKPVSVKYIEKIEEDF